jgi:hypothetical protein
MKNMVKEITMRYPPGEVTVETLLGGNYLLVGDITCEQGCT